MPTNSEANVNPAGEARGGDGRGRGGFLFRRDAGARGRPGDDDRAAMRTWKRCAATNFSWTRVTFQERVAVEASTDPSAVRDAHVVLFCVKGQDNEAAARAIAPHLAPDAIVVSLQNGVDNVEQIRAASGN